MLHVDHPDRPLDRALLDAPGGFAWWYADARNAEGDGLVLILSWGLPFLPGDRAARLAGKPPIPKDRPSVNLALYRKGHPLFYTLHTVDPNLAAWREGGGGRFGATEAHYRTTDTTVEMHVHVDVPIPGDTARLQGSILVSGPRLHGTAPDHAKLVHAWTPLMGPAHCTATLTRGGAPYFSFEGSGYADRNGSPVPLDGLELDRWTWGRATVGGRALVHYLSWPSDAGQPPSLLLWEAGEDGAFTLREADRVTLHGATRTWLGMTWWPRIELEIGGERVIIESEPPVDTGPFYLRLQTRVTRGAHTGFGWSEICVPDRIDGALLRPLIRMCVHPDHGPASMWLPLFVGPHADRLARLWRAWRGVTPLIGSGGPG